jgi:hypothetical protein
VSLETFALPSARCRRVAALLAMRYRQVPQDGRPLRAGEFRAFERAGVYCIRIEPKASRCGSGAEAMRRLWASRDAARRASIGRKIAAKRKGTPHSLESRRKRSESMRRWWAKKREGTMANVSNPGI